MFKPFFVHFNRTVSKKDNAVSRSYPRGFTMYVAPSDQERVANVQVAFCAAKDHFSKAEGRSFALKAKVEKVNMRDIPKLAAACQVASLYAKGRLEENSKERLMRVYSDNYSYLWKYML